ncbi:hypothetical protein LG634_34700 [Streptomyces bambusae]|uniref:hypothetical protein n=1 Tax=Streptomyces bambusae TaxID=1550616 RepID=UPI001CFFC096|nr:hypothetical protein [Streptomyces bambusae]MCB5169939.1 hypothetical protein [Streptomyces bambusae]
MSALDDPCIKLVSEGLEVHVPGVKGRPPRDVAVAYGEHPDTCPVRCWLAWQQTLLTAGAAPGGPAFLPVDQWGHLGTVRLAPDSCGRAMTRAAEQAGLEARITGHSGRRGVVTTGRRKGKRAEKLRAQGGSSAKSAVFWWVRRRRREVGGRPHRGHRAVDTGLRRLYRQPRVRDLPVSATPGQGRGLPDCDDLRVKATPGRVGRPGPNLNRGGSPHRVHPVPL